MPVLSGCSGLIIMLAYVCEATAAIWISMSMWRQGDCQGPCGMV